MSMVLRYAHVPRPDGTLRKAPYMLIFVRDENNKLYRWIALVDSGADFSIISKDTALFLGLKEKKTGVTNTMGIGGPVKVKESKLTFQIKNEREKHSVTVPVLILQENKADVPIILGRNGFFEQFHITIRQNEEKVALKKINTGLKY